MQIKILNRWTNEVLWEGEAESLRDAVEKAVDTDANLTGAKLTGADLAGAKLTGADLTGAKLTGADITRADITRADLTGARLTDLGFEIPVVADLDRKVAAAVGDGGEHLDMGHWHHACGTTHCRAGWAITLAGEAGKVLEQRVGPSVAGALIYFASTGRPPPNFFTSDAVALADIKHCAAEAGA